MQHLLMAVDEKLDMTNLKIQGVLNTINKICQCRSCLKALVRNLKNEDYIGAPAATNHPALAMQSSVSRPAATSLQPTLALLKKDILPPVTLPAAFLPPFKSPVVPVPKHETTGEISDDSVNNGNAVNVPVGDPSLEMYLKQD